MMRHGGVMAAALAAILLSAAAPGAAATAGGKKGDPLALSYSNKTELAALQLALDAAVSICTAFAEGKQPEPSVTASAAPPPGVTPKMIGAALGQVLAAAGRHSESMSSLGDPGHWPMGDGSRNAYFRIPAPNIKIRGTCVFIHGCYHGPESWFYKSPNCPGCTGLPEEVAHTKGCLARGYIVLALASKDQSNARCFSAAGNEWQSDVGDVMAAIKSFTKKVGVRSKPIYMWGISAGGSFAVKFPLSMHIDGVVSEVNMPWEKKWHATDMHGHLLKPFPPVAYYMMQRDNQTRRQIEKAVDILHNNGVNADYVYVPSVPLYPSFFYRRSIIISKQQSAAIVSGLKAIGAITKEGWIKVDPRLYPQWKKGLRQRLPWLGDIMDINNPLNLNSDESQITEEMNLAWAWHEIVGQFVRPTLMWLEAGGNANLTELTQIYSIGDNLRCMTEYQDGCPDIPPNWPSPSPPPAGKSKSPPPAGKPKSPPPAGKPKSPPPAGKPKPSPKPKHFKPPAPSRKMV